MGVLQVEFSSLLVHTADERLFPTCHMLSECDCGIVSRLDQHRLEQLTDSHGVARPDPRCRLTGAGRPSADLDRFIQLGRFQNHHRRHDLGGTRHGPLLFRFACPQLSTVSRNQHPRRHGEIRKFNHGGFGSPDLHTANTIDSPGVAA